MANIRRRGQRFTIDSPAYAGIARAVESPDMRTSKTGYAYLVGRCAPLSCDVSVHFQKPGKDRPTRYFVRWPHLEYDRETTLKVFPDAGGVLAYLADPHGAATPGEACLGG